ncbi:MAG: UDP-N-acetylpyruvoylglucosamine reductase [Candidatus Nomurabacteria bacterium GW2011_GWF2_35_66]|uniref:UDP-N-acetylenolpyruvoylglucosamine reductase n=1 Tax=Candidatus Nomurabacteria bacterium GW2011_GWE1_35_16 TaxID=1618761 RepID=A0A0G0EE92_9BACT|nr:MAG: UDP-N-acetylpyruvoylglucosamine reductase [Candidatus Nomurabacteria bacterium GW2011_GWF1_34_20]KKP63175.1 MAG: UDP-N-acetylpyruvoylglucosamine reductase [Candidatus Nomurabacteria bacterium GW2011_GWE2_34_25]KKP65652.1 MAG: UDP-N-acetylpyruvoylglucosamine reductase [Candidatus Nomurabacteria bacterium GW2011_GWE1_35_16]KKP83261.1 MAG: UDP-N-acetylpyruvoylglucosamine reductase [Candidatus Nomurabacteria bacterium GW2011_GWF2_35_66]HAE36724.1 UDP-N-acetylmuramate dehydrogenase [Candidat
MVEIQEYVDIKNYSTLHAGGQFRYFATISSVQELTSACAIVHGDVKYKNISIFILGGGSNMIFSDGVLPVLALKIEINGFEIINETNEYTDIKVGAGENWDQIVKMTVDMNLSGIEALSAIPGIVGASPVQNIGAYGSEVKDTILEVEVFDIKKGLITMLSNEECKFSYRDSIFKREARGKYVITQVTYRLSKSMPVLPDYPGVKKYFIENNFNSPTPKNIRQAVISIRQGKLPNPKEIPNVGSFFKNPIVEKTIADKIKMKFPNVKLFPIDRNFTKIPAGFLIENAGLKGRSFGKVSIYEKNALVLINTLDATSQDIISARDEIIRIVKDKFGIELVQEPEIL